MINDQKLMRDIMGRVKTIYWGKLLMRPAFELVVLLALIFIAKQLVFWQAAVLNMAHLSITGWLGYALGAFWQTENAIKVVLVVGLVLTVKIVWDALQMFGLLAGRRSV